MESLDLHPHSMQTSSDPPGQPSAKCGPVSTEAASPVNVLEIKILSPIPDPSQKLRRWGPATCILRSPPNDSDALKLESLYSGTILHVLPIILFLL